MPLLFAAGCAGGGMAPSGLSPTLDGKHVRMASNNRAQLMTALQQDASFGTPGAPSWYDVTLAGFNYVDDQCAVYFSTLFRLNREKESIKSGLTAFGQTTNAILSITGAAQLTISVVAQAFGLAGNMTDILAGTYLFELPTTKKFVDETRHAYRTGMVAERATITSAAVSYGFIRGYLNLCLPATIEAQLTDHIGGARAIAAPGPAGGDIAVRVVSDVSAFDLQALREPASVSDPLPAVVLPPLPTDYEKLVTAREWGDIQRLLCMEKVDGTIGPATRKAIVEYFRGRSVDRPDILITGVLEPDVRDLKRLLDVTGGKTCAERGFTTPFEVGLGSV